MSLTDLALRFLIFSCSAVGGANATLPEMHRLFVEQLHLMSEDRFSQLYALAQAAPGPNVLFVSLFGWDLAGFSGALVCLVAMCLPSCLLAIAVERLNQVYQDHPLMRAFRQGLTPIGMGLIFLAAFMLARPIFDLVSGLIILGSVVALYKFAVKPQWLLLLGALLEILLH